VFNEPQRQLLGASTPTESWLATSFECMEVFYHRKRRHSTLGYQSSTWHMGQWHIAQQEKQAA
jgi:hypothetical protein